MKRKMTVGIILVISGVILLFYSFMNHVTDYIEMHKSRSLNNAETIDDNINELINDYRESLEFLTNHEVFFLIQENWQKTGDTERLKEYLKDHILSQGKHISDILVIRDEEIVFSVKETNEYKFEEMNGAENIYFCQGKDKKYHLAVANETADNIRYMIVIDLEKFYNATANEKNQLRDGAIFLSVDGQFVIYSQHGKQYIGPTREVQGRLPESECVTALLEAHKEKKEGIISYEHYNPVTKESQNGYILSIPAGMGSNGVFTIGVMVNFGDTINSIQSAMILALGSGIIVAIGSIILFNALRERLKENKRRERELEKANLELQERAHRQRLETIGVLTSGIAHEFNNLLTPIMGYSMMLMEKLPEDDEEMCDSAIEIYNASRQAKEIISRLAELSRKKDTVTYEKLCIDEVIDKVLNIVRASQPEKIVIEKDMNCKDITVSGNETLIMQMILNLVLNAFQMMEETGGVVNVGTRIEEESVQISVGDTGPGISEEIIDKIFEPFFTTKHATKGTGLGLSIVNQVVEVHNGKIQVRNKAEGGCVFDIYLPYNKETIIQ